MPRIWHSCVRGSAAPNVTAMDPDAREQHLQLQAQSSGVGGRLAQAHMHECQAVSASSRDHFCASCVSKPRLIGTMAQPQAEGTLTSSALSDLQTECWTAQAESSTSEVDKPTSTEHTNRQAWSVALRTSCLLQAGGRKTQHYGLLLKTSMHPTC